MSNHHPDTPGPGDPAAFWRNPRAPRPLPNQLMDVTDDAVAMALRGNAREAIGRPGALTDAERAALDAGKHVLRVGPQNPTGREPDITLDLSDMDPADQLRAQEMLAGMGASSGVEVTELTEAPTIPAALLPSATLPDEWMTKPKSAKQREGLQRLYDYGMLPPEVAITARAAGHVTGPGAIEEPPGDRDDILEEFGYPRGTAANLVTWEKYFQSMAARDEAAIAQLVYDRNLLPRHAAAVAKALGLLKGPGATDEIIPTSSDQSRLIDEIRTATSVATWTQLMKRLTDSWDDSPPVSKLARTDVTTTVIKGWQRLMADMERDGQRYYLQYAFDLATLPHHAAEVAKDLGMVTGHGQRWRLASDDPAEQEALDAARYARTADEWISRIGVLEMMGVIYTADDPRIRPADAETAESHAYRDGVRDSLPDWEQWLREMKRGDALDALQLFYQRGTLPHHVAELAEQLGLINPAAPALNDQTLIWDAEQRRLMDLAHRAVTVDQWSQLVRHVMDYEREHNFEAHPEVDALAKLTGFTVTPLTSKHRKEWKRLFRKIAADQSAQYLQAIHDHDLIPAAVVGIARDMDLISGPGNTKPVRGNGLDDRRKLAACRDATTPNAWAMAFAYAAPIADREYGGLSLLDPARLHADGREAVMQSYTEWRDYLTTLADKGMAPSLQMIHDRGLLPAHAAVVAAELELITGPGATTRIEATNADEQVLFERLAKAATVAEFGEAMNAVMRMLDPLTDPAPETTAANTLDPLRRLRGQHGLVEPGLIDDVISDVIRNTEHTDSPNLTRAARGARNPLGAPVEEPGLPVEVDYDQDGQLYVQMGDYDGKPAVTIGPADGGGQELVLDFTKSEAEEALLRRYDPRDDADHGESRWRPDSPPPEPTPWDPYNPRKLPELRELLVKGFYTEENVNRIAGRLAVEGPDNARVNVARMMVHEEVMLRLKPARLFSVTGEMTGYVQATAERLPDGWEVAADDVPSVAGLMVFGQPIYSTQLDTVAGRQYNGEIVAVSWGPTERRLELPEGCEDAVALTFWSALDYNLAAWHLYEATCQMLDEYRAKVDPRDTTALDKIEELAARRTREWAETFVRREQPPMIVFGQTMVAFGDTGPVFIEYDQDTALRYAWNEDDAERQLVRTVLAAWLLMKQEKTTEIIERPQDRKKARRHASKGMDTSPVQVVRINRPNKPTSAQEDDQNKAKGAKKVYHCSFEVSAHWRRYHVGEGRQTVKRVWIAPYLAGDATKPFKAKKSGAGTVNLLDRPPTE